MVDQALLLLASAAAGLAAALGTLLIEPIWDRIARRYVRDLAVMLDALDLGTDRLPQFMRWWGCGLAFVFIFFTFGLGMWPVAIVATYIAFKAPRFYLQSLIARRSFLLRDQLVGALTSLANAVRAGLPLAEGMRNVSSEIPEPLSTEFRRIVRDNQAGRPLAAALIDARNRLRIDSFTVFVSALLVSLERGGKITEALDRICRSLQENQRLERKLDADTESGRKVVVILGAFPVVFLALFYFLNREGTTLLFTTFVGQFVLLVVIGLVYAAVRWANRILTLNV